MSLSEGAAAALVVAGSGFFLAGTVGLLRFPDVYTRLHALTKADNVGLGLVTAGLALHSGSWLMAAKLLLIWVLVMVSSATVSHLIARAAMRAGMRPWRPT
jgi:multicomponent Na+:H+ antiporter subunit G